MSSPLAYGATPAAAEIREVVLPLRRLHHTASTEIAERRLLLLRLIGEDAEGWGECGPVPGYSRETLAQCRDPLRRAAAALVQGRSIVELPAGPPPAVRFAVETAAADLAGRRAGVSLREALDGGRPVPIPVGAVIGLDVQLGDVAKTALSLAAEGYRRVKLKVAPENAVERTAAARRALEDGDLAVDANCSYHPSAADAVAALDRFDLSFIEQPFPAGADEAHRRLASSIATPICLDESVTDSERAAALLDTGAAAIVNVKPARVGGLLAALAIHDVATERGAGLWCGGMLESGIGKAAALAIAGLPGMTMPADLPPSSRHFRSDVVSPPWEMKNGCLLPQDRPGLGITVNTISLEASTVAVETVGTP